MFRCSNHYCSKSNQCAWYILFNKDGKLIKRRSDDNNPCEYFVSWETEVVAR